MASEYRTYLAANILNEHRVITYRLLSRALKVHVNHAKAMLFEFHRQQNGKKPGTVHATYLVAGSRRRDDQMLAQAENRKNGEDSYIQSSPAFASPQPGSQEYVEDTPMLSVTLVREVDLEELRKSYESIISIHVYSLGPSPIKDLQILSDANREIVEKYTDQDPLETAPIYGTIINKNVRRRTGRRPPTTATTVPPPSLKAETSTLKEEAKAPSSSKLKTEPVSSSQSSTKASKEFFGKGTTKKDVPMPKSTPAPSVPAPLKRGASGGIFASFAKAKPKMKSEGTDISAETSPAAPTTASVVEDSPMKDVSDDEEETYVAPPQKAIEIIDHDRKSRKEREVALAKMMEEDDDEDSGSPAVPEGASEEEMETATHDLPPPSQAPKEYVEVSGGRRRGRRRVTKKKTIKDEEGYLVTKEEPAWESFSEDEPVVKAKPPTSSAPSGLKAKKPASKPGQGNIMSFFAKKT